MSHFFRTFVAEMSKIGRVFILFWLCMAMAVQGQDISMEEVLEDVFNQLDEEGGNLPYEDIEEELLEIAANPIDLNQTNAVLK